MDSPGHYHFLSFGLPAPFAADHDFVASTAKASCLFPLQLGSKHHAALPDVSLTISRRLPQGLVLLKGTSFVHVMRACNPVHACLYDSPSPHDTDHECCKAELVGVSFVPQPAN